MCSPDLGEVSGEGEPALFGEKMRLWDHLLVFFSRCLRARVRSWFLLDVEENQPCRPHVHTGKTLVLTPLVCMRDEMFQNYTLKSHLGPEILLDCVICQHFFKE